ncbi:MAG TPA: CBS domain-containing protein [Armatimonadota bacterium]|jgi:CBS domain-containing protein/anti-sigma regulatory factor (Ser/Thr protein kinase)
MLYLPHISRVHELIYELPTERVMRRDVITVGPDMPMRELKEVLRLNRVSGVPVMEEGRLIGVISIENLIRWLEDGAAEEPVRERMTRRIVSVKSSDSVVEAVKRFAHYGVGRLPVVDDDGSLAGILTAGDITRGLLEALGLNYEQQECLKTSDRSVLEELVSDRTELSLWYWVRHGDFHAGGSASSKLKRVLVSLGADPEVVRRAAIASYEAEMNLVIHSDNGGELTATVEPHWLRVVAMDRGPGIEDVEAVMRPGFSTAPNWIRELGFGAGMGLANIRRCSDRMNLESQPGVGTRLEMIFRLHPREGV